MGEHERVQTAGQPRRNFLKVAYGAAAAIVAAKDAFARGANPKSSSNTGPRPEQPVDRGIWATWYDLPADGRDDYLGWLHGSYLPGILRRPGYVWAAHYQTTEIEGGAANATRFHHVDDPKVGAGYNYILLIGATDAGVFGNPTPSAIHASLTDADRKMLALRMGERVNLLTEACRQRGQAGTVYKEGAIGAPYMQMGSFICPPEFEEEMLAVYVQLRFPAVCETSSCVMIRKLNSVAGWAKHAILYEYQSREGYDRDYGPATKKSVLGFGGHSIVPNFTHAPNGPNIAARIWPPVQKA
jgi:hypothetical protein